jgi:hypothetical protein
MLMVVAAVAANAKSATQALDTSAFTIRKSVAAARIHSGCGISTSQTAETAAVFTLRV